MAKIFNTEAAHEVAGRISLPKVYERLEAQPVDPTDVFDSIEDAKKYAKNDGEHQDERQLCATSFIGQTLSIVETVEDTTIVSHVMIDENSDLDPIVTVNTAWEIYTGDEE